MEGKLVSTYVSELESKVEQLDRYLHELAEGLDHERDRRRSLEQTVQAHRIELLEDCSKNAYFMLEYERKCHALPDELSSAHHGFEDLRTRHENLQIQHENLVRDHKNLLGILEKGGVISVRGRNRVLVVRAEPTHIKRRMRSHPTWQFHRVRIASAMQYTEWPNKLG